MMRLDLRNIAIATNWPQRVILRCFAPLWCALASLLNSCLDTSLTNGPSPIFL